MNKLIIGGREFSSRLFVGTGKFSSNELMEKAIEASGSEMITVAMKRINMTQEATDDMLTHIDRNRVQFLPNTSGVRNAEEAVLAAQFSRECFGTDFVKLEIHPDPKYLLPDPVETLKATEQLAKLGFVVLPYIQADPVLCKRLEEVGAVYLHFVGLAALDAPVDVPGAFVVILGMDMLVFVKHRRSLLWMCMPSCGGDDAQHSPGGQAGGRLVFLAEPAEGLADVVRAGRVHKAGRAVLDLDVDGEVAHLF